MTTKKQLANQSETAATPKALPFGANEKPAEPAPSSVREKIAAMKKGATAAVSRAVSAVASGSASDPIAERKIVATPFGTFYDSPATRRLLTRIAFAEALMEISASLKRMDREAALTGLRGLGKFHAELSTPPQSEEMIIPALLLSALEDGRPLVAEGYGDLLRHFHHRANETFSYRGNGSTQCEQAPTKYTIVQGEQRRGYGPANGVYR
ncbi:hypothetical protein [Variovorax sp. PBL-E5]|uniref:hypothetical protein n=1 Tax=Variovorax sp. PBL-E5 TaxID=434014 RepID=UPI001317BC16|nr:hypothetical protein [Variovorax sp. PBL-E5]VTU29951.1 hypothetical protein E5CHR_02915 [Variovorax sp. PBL-E5]